ncbi:purine-nucleoside phosphorylase [Brevifollis gellanilyticus]|uniref:purine-nucleoside phosphorylase n=1 Tax=Brevifollis gellanilyticus TaxID=748831 RepID=A0A512MDB0_9BACT|nr:purine-nucleoside phosphorylase [Brevifollis gellanilyticus]GEP44716.1 purine nucleoside phosphorylase [Brevifollis gellanilyticus]
MSLSHLQSACPETAIVLGSGLGSVVDDLGIEAEVPFADVPGLSASTVPGHAGRLVLSRISGKAVLIAQGRRHLYEGLSAYEVTASIRFMHELGVKRVVLTNAAGAIKESMAVGELMLITDHLNLQGTTPLLGGPHFHDMSEVYSATWRDRFLAAAAKLQMPLHEGVYAALLGPQYETPAEIRMLRTLGADAVGMSTVPEAIQARALGMEVAGISMLTNWAAGLKPQTLDHSEVVAVGKQASVQLAKLLAAVL